MNPPTRIAVTGSAGYLGRGLVRHLLARPHVELVVGLDVNHGELIDDHRYRFVKHDIRRPCAVLLVKHGLEAVVHLAFCFAPVRKRSLATEVNVGGTRQLLVSCLRAQVRTLLYCSSGTAYGALPSNTRPLREDDPLQAGPSFQYAFEKRLTDEMWQETAGQHPDRRVLICRPPVVMGPEVDNYLSRMINKPVVFLVRGRPAPMQFIHERDVAAGLALLLERAPGGVYNLAPPDTVTLPEAARWFGRRPVQLPAGLLYPATTVTYALRLSWINEVPAGFLDYVRYPWVLDASRAERDLGLRCRYSSRQAVEDWHRASTMADS